MRANSWARSAAGAESWTGSIWTHSASPTSATLVPRIARCSPRMTRTSTCVGRRTASSIRARVPIRAYRPPILGTRKTAESAPRAASMAFRESSVSRAMVTTMPGSTTPVVRGRRGTTNVFGRSSSRLVLIVFSSSFCLHLLFTNETPAAYIPEVSGRLSPRSGAAEALFSTRECIAVVPSSTWCRSQPKDIEGLGVPRTMVGVSHSLVASNGRAPKKHLVTLHGAFGAGRNWGAIARRLVLARPEWGVVLADLRLHGDSQGFSPPHTLDAAAADIDELGRTLGFSFDAVLGHSLGGKVALRDAARHARALQH